MDTEPALRYLTASLHVDYLKPTPLGVTLEVRGKVKNVSGRKVVIQEWITARGEVTVRGKWWPFRSRIASSLISWPVPGSRASGDR